MLSKSLIYIILTILCAFALSLTLGWILIPMLRRLKAGQEIREVGPNWHATKAGTPTMGGLTFIGASFLCLVFGIGYMKEGDFSALYVLVLSLCFGLIGFLDDFFKVRYHRNLGLTAIQKAMLQLAVSALFLYILFRVGLLTCDLYLPFVGKTIYVHPMVYMVFAMFVMVGCVNAVNLTDGIDGLATGVTMPVMLFFTAVACFWGQLELGIFSAGLFGGLCGFLIYNFHPAKVFMGDTGSLFLGGAVCGLAFALDIPLVLILVGIIYILETLSDILQVGYFKLTHGKRIFRMAPLHHHLELGGWSEVKLFCVFSGVTLLACVLAFLGVMGR